MRHALQRAATGTPSTFFISLTAVLGLSVMAWGLWGAGDGVGSAGLMSIESRPAAAAVPPASPTNRVQTGFDAADVPAVEAALIEPAAKVGGAQTHAGPMFDGRPLRPARQLDMKVTAYSPDEQSCGKWADGWTASGYSVWTNGMRLVAADTSLLPFGTIVSIPGYNNGEPVQVLDIGGAIKGNRLDVLYPTHERALQWGVQQLEVTVWEYAD